MNARNDIRVSTGVDVSALKRVLAVTQSQLAAQVDAFVARWLERRATNAVAAQRLFGIKAEQDAQT